MDYQALEDELRNDPEAMGYQTHIDSGNHNAIVDLLRSDDPAGAVTYEPLGSDLASRIAAESGAYGVLADDAGDTSSSTRSKSLAAINTLKKPNADFALDHPKLRNMLQDLVDNGPLEQTQADAFLNKSQRPMRREEAVLGAGVSVDHTDVAKALS